MRSASSSATAASTRTTTPPKPSPPSPAPTPRLVVAPSNGRIAYAIDDAHVYATTDGGTPWADIPGAAARSGALPVERVRGLALAKVTAPTAGPSLSITLCDATTLRLHPT